MGQAGRARAREVYDWAAVIAQYETLWGQLNTLRAEQGQKAPALAHPWPARIDPFHAFASYPTHTLKPDTLLALVDAQATQAMARVQTYKALSMVNFAKLVLPSDDEILAVLQAAQAGPQAAVALVAQVPAERQAFVFRSLAWLVKLHVLKTPS
jgi:hypothetical protein